jgi:hypothetical protein
MIFYDLLQGFVQLDFVQNTGESLAGQDKRRKAKALDTMIFLVIIP